MSDVAFKYLRRPPVLADQLDKTAAAQIDRPDAGACFFNTSKLLGMQPPHRHDQAPTLYKLIH